MICILSTNLVAALMVAISHQQTESKQLPGTGPGDSTALGRPTQANKNSFNPQISLITNFGAVLSDNNPSNDKSAGLREAELGIAADVDPFLKAEAYIAFATEDGKAIAEVEEAFGRYSNLGRGVSAKFGKIAAAIGRVQRNHADQLNYLEYPLIVSDFLGEEGLRAGGASFGYLFKGERFNELTIEALDASDAPLFAGAHSGVPVWVGHYRTFMDFGENASMQLGATYANGPSGGGGQRSQLWAADMVYKWTPGTSGKSLVIESEAYLGRPGFPGAKSAFGGFASATYQLKPNLFGYIKFDYSEVPGTSNKHKAYSLGLTLRPTEFHHWRVEFQHANGNFMPNRNALSLQFQMAIGAHPAHKY
ncbi:MAG: hypothetical protein ABL949_03800 [Fimbriimonadaceae bacterium]